MKWTRGDTKENQEGEINDEGRGRSCGSLQKYRETILSPAGRYGEMENTGRSRLNLYTMIVDTCSACATIDVY